MTMEEEEFAWSAKVHCMGAFWHIQPARVKPNSAVRYYYK